MEIITDEKLRSYFSLTKKALAAVKISRNLHPSLSHARGDFLDMIERYVSDAEYFAAQGELVNAFAALNYAHGWIDAGARLGLFDVHDTRLFAQD